MSFAGIDGSGTGWFPEFDCRFDCEIDDYADYGTVFADDAPGYGVMRLPQTRTTLLDADAPIWHDAIAIEWGPDPYRTRFRACWDPIALHVRFDALDDAPWHTMTTRDDHIWEEEVVEIFLDLDGPAATTPSSRSAPSTSSATCACPRRGHRWRR